MPRAAPGAVDAAIAAGARPVTVTSASRTTVYLVLGARRVAILQQAGRLTDAGRRYEAATGRALPAPSIWRGPSYIVGRSTFVDVVGLGRKRLSTMIDGQERLTAYGRRWYADHPVERVIRVPIRVTAVRLQNGHVYRREDTTTPLTWQANVHESDPNYLAQLIDFVRSTLPPTWNQSNEFVELREDVPPEQWTVLSRRVTFGDGGEIESRVTDQPLHAPDGRQTFTPAPMAIADTAYQTAANCVIHQLEGATGLSARALEDHFTEAAAELYGHHLDGYPFEEPGDWFPAMGVTPKMVLWLCQRLNFSCHGFWESSKVMSFVVPAGKRRGCVCFSFSSEHFWLLEDDAHRLSHLSLDRPGGGAQLIPVATEKRRAESRKPPADLAPWRDDGPAVPVGSWFVESSQKLLDIRSAFLLAGRVPKVAWSDLSNPRSLTYIASKAEVPGSDRRVYVRVVPPEREFLKRASQVLGFDYELEAFPGWMLRAFQHCLKGKREVVPAQQKAAILTKQRGRCLHCGASFSDELPPEFDHETPVGHDLSPSPVIRAMCGGCHAEKTAEQAAHSRALVSLESHLSDELWDALVEGRPPLAVVFEAEPTPPKKLCHVDRRQSRTNILRSSKYPWPVYLPCDRIEPYDRQGLGDFCYVLHRRRAVDDRLHEEDLVCDLPLRGDGWYHRSVVEVCLDWKVIRLDDITHVARASAHGPCDRVSKAFQEAIMPLPVEKIAVGDKEMNLQRQSGHVLVGLWGRRRRERLHGTTSRCPQDEQSLALGATYRSATGVEGWFDYISATPLVARHTNFLLHRKVIDEESALLARLARSLRIKTLFQINTDSLLYDGKLASSDDDVRACMTHEGRLRGRHKLPLRDDPRPAPSEPWRDVSAQEATEHVLAGGSLMIEGMAGCGKSFLLRDLVRRLREQGKTVQLLATTHVACANLEDAGAMTCARYTYWYGRGGRKPDVLVLDEVSLVDPFVWVHLASILHHAGCACIFAGDWAQLPPVSCTWLGLPVQTMRDTPFLRERCGWTRCVLTECRRSDGRLFDFYSAIARNPEPLADWVRKARAEFPPLDGPSPVNLCQSHKRRMALIRELQDVYRPAEAILVNPESHNCRANAPQQIWLWPGQELICANRLQGFRNQWSYKVVRLTETEAHLRPVGGDAVHKLSPLSRVAELFRAPWARTYHSAQGLGFDRVRLWDTSAMHFSASHLIVGMSRCRRSEALDFGYV